MKFAAMLMTTLLMTGCASIAGNPDGGLAPCPAFPGCAEKTWTVTGSSADAWTAIADYVTSMSNMTIVQQTDAYLQVEAHTAMMGFVDDLEFLLKEDGTIAARSSSRIGFSDLGANEARLTMIRDAIPQLR